MTDEKFIDNHQDSKELADALRALSKDYEMSPADDYYMEESAQHIESLYKEYLRVIAQLKK